MRLQISPADQIHPISLLEFAGNEALVEGKCVDAGLQYVVLNGLEPDSNRSLLWQAASLK